MSCNENERIVSESSKSQHSFVSMVMLGFAQHYPIVISPDDIWLLVLQGVSQHVNLHSHSLQSKFVDYQGVAHVRIITDPIVDWGRVVQSFDEQVKQLLRPETYAAFETPFSTTTVLDRQLATFALMDTCSNFITYEMFTCCGFPSITLKGTSADWKSLALKSEELITQCCLPEFGKRWTDALLPVLDRFTRACETGSCGGEDGELFWNSFLKRGGTTGSGGQTFYNGWIHVFFPYLAKNSKGQVYESPFCVPYSVNEDYVRYKPLEWKGPMGCRDFPFKGVTKFPVGVSKVPVKHNIDGFIELLAIESGFYGVKQDPKTMELECFKAWAVVDADEPTVERMTRQGNTQVGNPSQFAALKEGYVLTDMR